LSIPSGALNENISIKIELYNISCPPSPPPPYIPFFEISSQEVLYAVDLWQEQTITTYSLLDAMHKWQNS